MESTKHPSSDALRQIADWLDQNGGSLKTATVSFWTERLTPETFAELRARIGEHKIVDASGHYPQLLRDFGGANLQVFFSRDEVGTKRVVTREEFVIEEPA